MRRLAEAMERRCAEGHAGQAVRLLETAANELVRVFKAHMLQQLIDDAVLQALGPLRGAAKPGPTPWVCRECGPRLGSELRRNGHYLRRPLTCGGPVTLRIPQLLCRDCGKTVPFSHPLLPSRERLGRDIEQRVVELYLEGCSYRAVRRIIERTCQSTVGLMSIWRAFQRAGRRDHAVPARPPARYLALDEVYQKVGGEKRWFLSVRAQDEAGGKHWVGSVLSSERTQQAWQDTLVSLGISRYHPPWALLSDGDQAIEGAVATALPGVRLQRCVWHLKHNAAAWLQERYPRGEDEPMRTALMASVHQVVDAPTIAQRTESLTLLRQEQRWLALRLAQVLERVPVKDADHPVRTNNLCERGFRELRRRTRPMDGFGSDKGAANFHLLWMLKENARLGGRDYLAEILP